MSTTTFNAPTDPNRWAGPFPMTHSDGKPGTAIGTSFVVSSATGQKTEEGTRVLVDVVLSDSDHESLDLAQNGLAGLLLVGKLVYQPGAPAASLVVRTLIDRRRFEYEGLSLYLRRLDDLGGTVAVAVTVAPPA